MKELGNPFGEDGSDLVTLDSKECFGHSAIQTIEKFRKQGSKQFQVFYRDKFVESIKLVADTIHQNKLKVFKAQSVMNMSKEKQKLACLKKNTQLFSRLYLSCQSRNGNLDEFFRYENLTCPPALSD